MLSFATFSQPLYFFQVGLILARLTQDISAGVFRSIRSSIIDTGQSHIAEPTAEAASRFGAACTSFYFALMHRRRTVSGQATGLVIIVHHL